MIKVEIKNKATQIITHSTRFDTQELADEWISSQRSKGEICPWGRPAWTEQIPILDENGDPLLDENGEPTYNYTNHADEFTIIQTDISQQVALKNAKQTYLAHKSFGQDLAADFAVENAALGITVQESQTLVTTLSGVLSSLSNGFLETAIAESKGIDVEDYDGVYISETRLLLYVNRIEEYLGITASGTL